VPIRDNNGNIVNLSVVIAALLGVQLIDLRDGRLSGA
jgi:hypothetical protein